MPIFVACFYVRCSKHFVDFIFRTTLRNRDDRYSRFTHEETEAQGVQTLPQAQGLTSLRVETRIWKEESSRGPFPSFVIFSRPTLDPPPIDVTSWGLRVEQEKGGWFNSKGEPPRVGWVSPSARRAWSSGICRNTYALKETKQQAKIDNSSLIQPLKISPWIIALPPQPPIICYVASGWFDSFHQLVFSCFPSM